MVIRAVEMRRAHERLAHRVAASGPGLKRVLVPRFQPHSDRGEAFRLIEVIRGVKVPDLHPVRDEPLHFFFPPPHFPRIPLHDEGGNRGRERHTREREAHKLHLPPDNAKERV